MLAIAERRAKPKAERFNRPQRDGCVFLHHFPALRAGLLSLSPFLLRPSGYGGQAGTSAQHTIRTPYVDAYGGCRTGGPFERKRRHHYM